MVAAVSGSTAFSWHKRNESPDPGETIGALAELRMHYKDLTL